ncbi:MAG TPA: zinc ribbon domain-containing protein, partial [Candidatus Pacearchaeota archaeon]|nr:zinc ribbon domain-containing protein [Candidatus Pacearchaeota archaeon]
FAAVICEDNCSSNLVAYTLDIATAITSAEKAVITKEEATGQLDEQSSLEELIVGDTLSVEELREQLYPFEFKPGVSLLTSASSLTSFLIGYLVLWIILYIYFALCLYFIAKKTDTPNGWLAWIPVANVFLMIQIAQKPLWWFILLLIPFVNIVIIVILWMKIAERRGKPNWLGILMIVPVVGIIIPGYLAFSGKGKIEITPPYAATGTQEANKPVVGYKHPCKYCEKLIPPNSTVCPFCGKANPLGPYRCPKCHEPIEKEWQVCPKCNQNLRIVCPHCGKITFFGDHCEDCGARLFIKCPHCGQEQPPLSDNCIKCGKPLKVEKR